MKLLVLGLVPVVIFWFVEDKFGTFWGLIAAIVWAVGEVFYEYLRYKRVDRLTMLSTGLVVLLGGLGAWLDKSVLFKFQPVIVELVFAVLLVWGGRGGEPMLYKMAQKSRPEFAGMPPEVQTRQREMLARMTRHLIWVLVIHSALLSYVALHGTTGQWAFWKGVGFYVFVVLWGLSEFAFVRLQTARSRKLAETLARTRMGQSMPQADIAKILREDKNEK